MAAEVRIEMILRDWQEKEIALLFHLLRLAGWDWQRARKVLGEHSWWLA